MSRGGLIDLLREVAAYGGDDLRTDIINFRTTVPTTGAITQPTAEKLRGDYDHYIIEMRASMTGAGNTDNVTNADAKYDDVDEIRFNFRESGTGQNMYSTDIELALLVDSISGAPIPLSFGRVGYKIRAGADLSITVTRRATTITTQRVVNVALIVALVPEGFHTRKRKLLD